jgi:hypothetical protein
VSVKLRTGLFATATVITASLTHGQALIGQEAPAREHRWLESSSLAARAPARSRLGEVSIDFFGHLGAEARLFASEPLSSEQPRWLNLSTKVQPEVLVSLGDPLVLRATALGRLDQNDPQRSYFDLREALLQFDRRELTLGLGINTVFWGVTESRHLVNIINQTDYLDDLDGDEKLGQLMGLVSYDLERLGLFDLFVMTWARPQLFPGPEGRPGVPIQVLDDSPRYGPGSGKWNVDIALRWSHVAGGVDWALSFFRGTSREPELLPAGTPQEPTLQPRYDLIHQAGMEFQWTRDAWLWKGEAVVRGGQGASFAAATSGFEHTAFALFGSAIDLGTLVEYSYDGRDNLTFNIHDNDLFGGVRVSLNDVDGSEVLAGVLRDLDSGVTTGTLEASRRLGEGLRVELTGRVFESGDVTDPVYWFRRDDYLQMVLEYHF